MSALPDGFVGIALLSDEWTADAEAQEEAALAIAGDVGIHVSGTLAGVVLTPTGEVAGAAFEQVNGNYSFDVVVAPRWHGQGIGRWLIELMHEHAEAYSEAGVATTLHVVNLRLEPLLQRLGYQEHTRFIDTVLYQYDADDVRE